MVYLPHEKLDIQWKDEGKAFNLSLPWLSMEVEVTEEDKPWIENAIANLTVQPENDNTQRFLKELTEYPVSYLKPRTLEEFEGLDLQPCLDTTVDSSTPRKFLETFGCPISETLRKDCLPEWQWNWESILTKSRIPGTDLYDPKSFISYVICYRQEWESDGWSGQDGLGKCLQALVETDEKKFFQALGWVVRQSLFVTSEAHIAMEPALTHFEKAKDFVEGYIAEEVGHYKFMEQVFEDLELDPDDFPVGEGTKWSIMALERVCHISPLGLSALINTFEAAYYDGEDPISRIIRQSSKPEAARGYDLHYKINQDHRHCDIPMKLASFLAPQSYNQVTLTLGLFELTLHFLDSMERGLVSSFEV